ncbi:papain-like cysteine protease family protein [Olleya sp. Bg11-27]|uniref:papain-like cysteine protease family protein n=1 Tax=Olleya sp. Bg11-27 TaxID=2058135 RepID=UPI000C309968|nr:papain-like cysteine protease family protein [Olleya sp. Bg11-27]AUC75982.1 hypothetical protein CW732_10035 [Olleya sp. Bg11-27]
MSEDIKLDFKVELQAGQRMCWAAVAITVSKFYDKESESNQIDLAKDVFGENYDQFYSPESALSIYNNLSSELNRSLTRAEISEELINGRPITACMKHFVGWHLVVIYGISQNKLLIADPLLGEVQCEIDAFTDAYETYYSWTHTYKTKAANE